MNINNLEKLPEGALVELAEKTFDSKILDYLASYEDTDVRMSVAMNFNTSCEALTKLAYDESKWVRVGAAGNPNTPSKMLDKLATDDDFFVLLGVSQNRNTSLNTLVKLFNHKDLLIQKKAIQNIILREIPSMHYHILE